MSTANQQQGDSVDIKYNVYQQQDHNTSTDHLSPSFVVVYNVSKQSNATTCNAGMEDHKDALLAEDSQHIQVLVDAFEQQRTGAYESVEDIVRARYVQCVCGLYIECEINLITVA